jgi:hypothetical protein
VTTKRQVLEAQDHRLGPDLKRLADRLRAGDDAKRVADELDRLAANLAPRQPGRPKDPPAKRAYQRAKRQIVAEAVYQGTLPPSLYGPDLALRVSQAEGSRTEADAVAAEILGVSVRSIQAAREIRPMDRERWEEFLALQIFVRTKPEGLSASEWVAMVG